MVVISSVLVLMIMNHSTAVVGQEPNQDEPIEKGNVSTVGVVALAAAATGLVYYGGRQVPGYMRYMYLFLGINSFLGFPMASPTPAVSDTPLRERSIISLGIAFTGLAAMNHYYVKHPEQSKKERGIANVVGYWSVPLFVILVEPIFHRSSESLSVWASPVINRHRTGFLIQIEF